MHGPIYFPASLPHCGGPNLSSNATFHSTMTGWQSSLLNQMGRAVLVNSVLNSQLIYAMAALEIPPGIIDQVDRKRRSFLWSGSGTATGSRSMVAWQHVCDTKDMGGLGLKDLGIQNTCLLLKMIHKLHSNSASSWARWVHQNACMGATGTLSDPYCHCTEPSQLST